MRFKHLIGTLILIHFLAGCSFSSNVEKLQNSEIPKPTILITQSPTSLFPPTSLSTPTETFTSTPTPTPQPISTNEPTPTSTLIPVGGGGVLIAFISGKGKLGFSTVDINTGEINYFSFSEECNCAEDPVWSPDGTKIVFSDTFGDWIYIYDFVSNEIKRIIGNGSDGPTWSPDGEKIAFVSTRQGALRVYTMDSHGKNVKKHTDGLGYVHSKPIWSPDGKTLLLANQETMISDSEIVSVAFGSFGIVPLTSNLSNDLSPSWSPDGSQIVFTSDRNGNSDIFIMDANGSNQTQITFSESDEYSPLWSPNGHWISYFSYKDENFDIYIISPESGEKIRMTDHSGPDLEAVWSPDGSMLAFVSLRNVSKWQECSSTVSCNSDIYIIEIDTLLLTQITNNLSGEVNPAWQPKIIP